MTPPLTRAEAKSALHAALAGFASEAELEQLSPSENLREALELDSMDFLTFVERLSEQLGRRIEEDDYDHLATLDSAADFLGEAHR
ncbi:MULTISPECIES: acyl carrier protein [unclassified Amycolatopsis]|uniref:acyl carrier protein n=1 Tax=unclassified Amycolatopsis TaxID=2618356 RepID=UPI001C6A485F|nr:acyl carrier protein [Amycolatopsis sp. DSM 110486]QYN20332.1 acyl carrier protein [Amycolatopsis sp. DSM 110486]